VPASNADQVADLISAPLEELIVALGSGIGRSQAELDRNSIETQRRIDEDPVLAQYGLQASWYQIPRTQLELKINVSMQQLEAGGQTGVSPAPPPIAGARPFVAGLRLASVPRLRVEPVNATYQNRFGFQVEAASTMTLEVVPVPPPGPVATAVPQLTVDEVLEIASEAKMLDTPSQAVLYSESGAGWRTAANFNAGMRSWFVLQTREQDDSVRLRALVKIDDQSGEVLKTIRRS
jgi:hypothetical protein